VDTKQEVRHLNLELRKVGRRVELSLDGAIGGDVEAASPQRRNELVVLEQVAARARLVFLVVGFHRSTAQRAPLGAHDQ
jgi:hypothetical protein